MTEKVVAFLLNMLNMGLEPGQANDNTYAYAIALLREREGIGSYVSTATVMERAVELVKEAWTNKDIVRFNQERLLMERARHE